MPQDSSFDAFLRLSQELFTQGDYKTACHSLMAALDRASYLQDEEALAIVKQRASDQLADLLSKDLPARLAAEGPRRQQSLARSYHSLIQQATTWGQLVNQRRLRSARPPHPRRTGEGAYAERGETSECSR